MIGFLLRRAGWMVLTLWAIYTVSFVLMLAAPGGPFQSERNLPPEIRRNMQARYGFDKPPLQRYFHTLGTMLIPGPQTLERGWPDFGPSQKIEDFTINQVIAQGFPVSASLGILALVFALTFGITAGVISAVRRQTWTDFTFMVLATVGVAVPNFVLAGLAVMVFVFLLGWFPAAGWGTVEQIVQPALCLGAPYAGYIARLTRTGMLEVLSLDYIRTAYAKGLSEPTVVVRHALRGALTPVVSYLGPATAGVLTGSLVLEQIFVLPGMGSHFIEAAQQRDYPLAMAMTLVYAFLLFTMNTLVDLSYAILDPRVKLEG